MIPRLHRRARVTFRQQLAVALGLMLILPLALLLGLRANGYRHDLLTRRHTELQQHAHRYLDEVRRHLATRQQEIADIAYDLRQLDDGLARDRLKLAQASHSAFASLSVIDGDGVIIASSNAAAQGRPMPEAHRLQTIGLSKGSFAPVVPFAPDGGLVVLLAAELGTGRDSEVLVGSLYWGDLIPLVEDGVIRNDEGAPVQFVILVDEWERMILAPGFLLGNTTPLERLPFLRTGRAGSCGASLCTATIGGTEYAFVVVSAEEKMASTEVGNAAPDLARVAVMVFEDKDIVLAGYPLFLFHASLVLGWVVVAGFLLATLLAYRLTRQLVPLLQTTEQVIQGGVFELVPVLARNELGLLADRFNNMGQVISEHRRHLEEQARTLQSANERLREVDELKTKFLSTVSHELRTPLSAIVSAASIITRYHESKPGVVVRFSDTILNEGRRLTRMINNVLDLMRIESNSVKWNERETSVVALIEQAVTNIDPIAELKGLTVTKGDIVKGAAVWVDADRILQVLTNLLSNATKFTPRGGRITVGAQEENGCVVFSVTDTGGGIPESELENVFKKFHQLDASGHGDISSREGTGLGLTICREIIEHYGGKIWSESKLGQGSSFRFRLPVLYDSEQQAAKAVHAKLQELCRTGGGPHGGPVKRIAAGNGGNGAAAPSVLLVLEDSPLTETLVSALDEAGFAVRRCATVEQALATTRSWLPQVVIVSREATEQQDGSAVKFVSACGAAHVMVLTEHCDLIPARQTTKADPFLRALRNSLSSGAEVLVAEDDDDYRQVLEFQLQEAGYSVRTARDGADTLRAIEESRPGALVLDLIMPRMDGVTVLKHLSEAGIQLPVFLLTALDEAAVDGVASLFDVEGVFCKHAFDTPAAAEDAEQVRQVVEQALSRFRRPRTGPALPKEASITGKLS